MTAINDATYDTDYSCPGYHPDRDAPAEPVWCRPCQDRIIDALQHLPVHVEDLASRNDGRTSPLTPGKVEYEGGSAAGSKRANGAASPSPAWDNADKTIRFVLRTEDTLRDVTGDPPAERLSPATSRYRGDAGTTADRVRAFKDAIAYLVEYRTALLSLDDAWRIGAAIKALDRDLEKLTGRDRLIHRMPVPCPTCEHLSLVRQDGDDRVRCTRRECGRTWRPDQYAWFTHVAAQYSEEAAGAR